MERKRRKESGKHFSLFTVPSGWGAVVASEEGLMEVFLPVPQAPEEMTALIGRLYPLASAENEITWKTADLIARYFSGEMVEFGFPLDLEGYTDFQRSVYQAVLRIPYGTVKSYAEVAAQINHPKASRGIGSAMARNPLPIIIPCHRVIGSSGTLTGYSGPGGLGMKHDLLRMEGVLFDEKGAKVRRDE
jgi:methylated-DNA-[protein]-cysteine S-methyltransferase